jgi:cupin fold WbuC family metalloprotein
MEFKPLSPRLLACLSDQAMASPRARQHLNLHVSFEDPCQRVLNAIGVESYIRPHRHLLDRKVECLIAVRGLFGLVTFDDFGEITCVSRFGTEKHWGVRLIDVGVELPPGVWHTVLALVPDSVLLEVKSGPFDPGVAKELAPWAPAEGTLEANIYVSKLRNVVLEAG